MESTRINHVKASKLFNLWHNEFNIISEMCSFILSCFSSKACLYLTLSYFVQVKEYSQRVQVGKN